MLQHSVAGAEVAQVCARTCVAPQHHGDAPQPTQRDEMQAERTGLHHLFSAGRDRPSPAPNPAPHCSHEEVVAVRLDHDPSRPHRQRVDLRPCEHCRMAIDAWPLMHGL